LNFSSADFVGFLIPLLSTIVMDLLQPKVWKSQ
jgi:hypothetical protein